MRWLWIIGVLAVLLALLCLTRVGALAVFDGGPLRVYIRIGPLRLRVLPAKKKPEKKAEKKPDKPKPSAADRLKGFRRPTAAQLRDAWETLAPLMKKALRRTRRGVRIDPLDISAVLAGEEDPAAAAELYGRLNAAIWAGMPALEQLVSIPHPAIHTEVDFNAQATRLQGRVGVTLRVGTLLVMGAQVGVPILRWLLKQLSLYKKQAAAAPPQEPQAQTPAA